MPVFLLCPVLPSPAGMLKLGQRVGAFATRPWQYEIRNTKYEIFIASCTDKKYMETTMQQRAKDNIYD